MGGSRLQQADAFSFERVGVYPVVRLAAEDDEVVWIESHRGVASDGNDVMGIEFPLASMREVDERTAMPRKVSLQLTLPAVAFHHFGSHLAEFSILLFTLC